VVLKLTGNPICGIEINWKSSLCYWI